MKTRVFTIGEIKEAARLIAGGELVVFPTETVYGLGADALNPDAVAGIFAAKGRPGDNPLIVHIACRGDLDEYCRDIPAAARQLAARFWPGPLTLVLPKRDCIPGAVSAGLATVGIRFPAHPVAQALIREAGVPIAAPSANRSGKPSPTSFAHVLADMNGRVAGIIDGGETDTGLESTVVEFREGKVRVLRPGFITPEDISGVVGEENLEIDEGVSGSLAPDAQPRSPGMKYRHYAPSAPVIAVTGENWDCAREIRRAVRDDDDTAAILCDEYAGWIPGKTVTVGAYGDYARQAQRLFDALRSLDTPGLGCIYAQCPPEEGIGLAVANRLKRAAGFHIRSARKICVIGLTGPSGAGKGVAAEAFSALGAAVLDCDRLYHEMLREDTGLLAAIEEALPAAFINGSLDRKALGRIVFGDAAKLTLLNETVFPFITAEVNRRINALEARGVTAVVLDAPTLFESGAHRICDFVLGIGADAALRKARIMARDRLDADYAALRIAAGQPEDYYRARCDAFILNNTAPQAVKEAVGAYYIVWTTGRELPKNE